MREVFSFAQPNQILQAVRTYCSSMYGAMTWPLYSKKAREMYNCWSTCVKLAWGVPRSTHTFIVDNLLACGFPSIRSSLLVRFWKFFETVSSSSSLEVRVVANLASVDVRSTTGSNLHGIRRKFQLDSSFEFPVPTVRSVVFSSKSEVPAPDSWRLACLKKYLEERYSIQAALENTTEVDGLIDSICSS